MDSLFQSDRNLTHAISELIGLRAKAGQDSGFGYTVLDHAISHLWNRRETVKVELRAHFGNTEVVRA